MPYFDSRSFWRLVAAQHGVVAHRQLVALGMHPQAVKRRVASGRLHRLWRGVYAVGRPEIGRFGRWRAAVLACGEGALLGGESAASLMELGGVGGGSIDVVVGAEGRSGHDGIEVRRVDVDGRHRGTIHGIPVTSPARTLVDLARTRSRHGLDAAINEADTRGLIDPEALRLLLPDFAGVPGIVKLRTALDAATFVLTRSALERHFLTVARRVGLTKPITGEWINDYQVDFFWPALGLVIETDGLRYHRTAAKQAADLRRQQTHLAAGLWPLRFSHGQVAFEKGYVEETLRGMVGRIGEAGTGGRT